jgi:hypothetical protein
MKKLLLLSALFISMMAVAQVPQGISYQAIALNGSGTPVVSSNVRVKLSILDVSATGTVLYSETQLKATNPQGLFNLTIGMGTVVSGTFASISWGTNSKFLKVEMDAAGGTTYLPVGTTQLLTVPYAMHAATVASIAGNSSINDDIIENKSSTLAFDDYTANKIFVFNGNTGAWSSQTYNSNTSVTLENSNGSIFFDDYTDNKVYAYNGRTGAWSSQAYNSNTSVTLPTSNGNVFFDDYTANIIFSYNGKTGIWSSQPYDSNTSATFSSSNNNIFFDDYTANKIYAYNGKTGTWSSQAYDSNTSVTISASNGNAYFDDYTANKIYSYNGKTGTWSSQLYNSNTSATLIISNTN